MPHVGSPILKSDSYRAGESLVGCFVAGDTLNVGIFNCRRNFVSCSVLWGKDTFLNSIIPHTYNLKFAGGVTTGAILAQLGGILPNVNNFHIFSGIHRIAT